MWYHFQAVTATSQGTLDAHCQENQVALMVTEFHGATVLVKRKAALIQREVMSSSIPQWDEFPRSVRKEVTFAGRWSRRQRGNLMREETGVERKRKGGGYRAGPAVACCRR